MTDARCPLSAPLLSNEAVCQYSESVVRRGGNEIACHNDAANQRCTCLLEAVNNALIPELGYENDLTAVPHSVLQKIQYGSVLQLTGNDNRVDLADSVAAVTTDPASIEAFIKHDLLARVQSVKLRKRRGG